MPPQAPQYDFSKAAVGGSAPPPNSLQLPGGAPSTAPPVQAPPQYDFSKAEVAPQEGTDNAQNVQDFIDQNQMSPEDRNANSFLTGALSGISGLPQSADIGKTMTEQQPQGPGDWALAGLKAGLGPLPGLVRTAGGLIGGLAPKGPSEDPQDANERQLNAGGQALGMTAGGLLFKGDTPEPVEQPLTGQSVPLSQSPLMAGEGRAAYQAGQKGQPYPPQPTQEPLTGQSTPLVQAPTMVGPAKAAYQAGQQGMTLQEAIQSRIPPPKPVPPSPFPLTVQQVSPVATSSQAPQGFSQLALPQGLSPRAVTNTPFTLTSPNPPPGPGEPNLPLVSAPQPPSAPRPVPPEPSRLVLPGSEPSAPNRTYESYSAPDLVRLARGGDVQALQELIRSPRGVNIDQAVPNARYLLEPPGGIGRGDIPTSSSTVAPPAAKPSPRPRASKSTPAPSSSQGEAIQKYVKGRKEAPSGPSTPKPAVP